MNIILDTTLQAQPDNRTFDISHKITSLAHTQHPVDHDSTYKLIKGNAQGSLSNTGLVGLISHCYSKHLPVAIAPHDVWVLLLSEITKEVAQHPEQYRQYFTTSAGKEDIAVPSGSLTEIPIATLADALAQKVLFNTGLIFKNFSTETPIVTQTIQAIFCDMASPYYNYMMFCCGIPSIKLLGTTEDWTKLAQGFAELTQKFNTPVLQTYLDKVEPILSQFVNASQGLADVNFWKNIFTQKNVGSGGDLTVDGWITKLFITEHSFAKITHFTSTHGLVKYKQMETGQEFVAVYGGFDTQVNAEGFYELQYRQFTVQKVPRK